MLKKIDMSKLMPHLIAIAIFIALSFAYFSPVLEGKRLDQHDFRTFKGGAKEIIDFREQTGEEALWTNSMFGGMPAYLISVKYKGNLLQYVNRFLQIGPRPASQLFLLLIGAYILFLALRINPWLSIVGAIAIAFSSYNFIILFAGHNTKVIAIAYAAPVLAGVFLTFRGRRILGAALTGVFLSLQLLASHPQITYYTLLIILIFGASELIFSIKEKKVKDLLISTGLLIFVVIFSVLSNYSRLATTLEYDDFSMRTKSELSKDEEDKTEGLPLSYATGWSYGVDETFTLMIPGFKGGSSTYSLGKNSNTYEALSKLDRNFANNFIQRVNMYWGPQTSTSGPVYIGAVIIFLFVLGMFLLEGKYKWWMLAATILGVMLSWGKNFMPLTEFFMHYVPGYNKFRTVSMTLVIPQLVMPILALLTLAKIINEKTDKKTLLHGLKWSAGITGGLALLFILLPSLAGNFTSEYDMRTVNALAGDNSQARQVLAETLVPALEADREAMLRMDAFRTLVFILLSAGLIYLYRIKEIKMSVKLFAGLFALLVLVDLWPVNKRFLNDDNFVKRSNIETPFQPTQADQYILQSPGKNERVLNLTTSWTQDANTSYFHQSIGGYHGAKMRRYQDLINTRMMDELSILIGGLQQQSRITMDSVLQQLNVLNMLNTKYFIVNPNTSPITNPYAFGNAWFVEKLNFVENADQELARITDSDLEKTAVIDEKFRDKITSESFGDSNGTIVLADYKPNQLTYNVNRSTDGFAVFSEIYYEKGWNAKIDGKQVPHVRVDYLLRGLEIPAGDHTVVFEFRPKTYYTGEKVSLAGSLVLILLLIGAVYLELKGKGDII